MKNRPSWFEVGYDEGFAGKEYRPIEGQLSPRQSHRRGWDQGDMDRRLQEQGYSITGRVDPFLTAVR